jgi:hypothetical protein
MDEIERMSDEELLDQYAHQVICLNIQRGPGGKRADYVLLLRTEILRRLKERDPYVKLSEAKSEKGAGR